MKRGFKRMHERHLASSNVIKIIKILSQSNARIYSWINAFLFYHQHLPQACCGDRLLINAWSFKDSSWKESWSYPECISIRSPGVTQNASALRKSEWQTLRWQIRDRARPCWVHVSWVVLCDNVGLTSPQHCSRQFVLSGKSLWSLSHIEDVPF